MSIAATYVSASSFTVASDKAAEFVVGVRVQADCGADGVKYGVVTSNGTTTVAVTLDSGSLTSNLTGVLHGNDVPASLCNHGHTGTADGGALSAYVPKSLLTTAGDIIYATAAGTPARLGVGSEGQDLHVVSGVPAWVSAASDAEALAGIDALKRLTPSALAYVLANRANAKVVSFTHNMASVSDQSITGVGFRPIAIVFLASHNLAAKMSIGFADSVGSGACLTYGDTTIVNVSSSSAPIYLSSTSFAHTGSVKSFDSDGFTLAWSNVSSGTANITALCLR